MRIAEFSIHTIITPKSVDPPAKWYLFIDSDLSRLTTR